ncbi:MAG TPA: transcriptional repressor [Dehalococcoidia bacterium]|jgi:Fur family ferric uptake transcriptional regulator|nr:transcriptional repressor [Dehalococcoidia bacterium]
MDQLDSSIADKLGQRGYRLTPQRLMVLAAIENSDDHVSAEEIYAQVVARYPYVNISTVYRTLELLKELGLVTEIDLGEGRVRYHPVDKGHHHHLVCQKCGAIIDVDESTLARLQDVLLARYNFSASLRHVAIFGTCGKCRQQQ